MYDSDVMLVVVLLVEACILSGQSSELGRRETGWSAISLRSTRACFWLGYQRGHPTG